MAVTFELHPREIKTEQCWIFADGELVEKCASADRIARLAAHGRIEKSLTKTAQLRMERQSRQQGGWGMGNRYSGR